MKVTINLDDEIIKKIEDDAFDSFRTRMAQIEFIVNSYYRNSVDFTQVKKKINKSSETTKLLKQL